MFSTPEHRLFVLQMSLAAFAMVLLVQFATLMTAPTSMQGDALYGPFPSHAIHDTRPSVTNKRAVPTATRRIVTLRRLQAEQLKLEQALRASARGSKRTRRSRASKNRQLER